jgi:hypothetical protein
MKRDPIGDRLKELEDNPAKVQVDDEIIRLIEEIRNEQNESKIRQMVSNIKDLADASKNLNCIEKRVDIRKDDGTIPSVVATALSFAFLVVFENRHVLPRAISWIKRV